MVAGAKLLLIGRLSAGRETALGAIADWLFAHDGPWCEAVTDWLTVATLLLKPGLSVQQVREVNLCTAGNSGRKEPVFSFLDVGMLDGLFYPVPLWVLHPPILRSKMGDCPVPNPKKFITLVRNSGHTLKNGTVVPVWCSLCK